MITLNDKDNYLTFKHFLKLPTLFFIGMFLFLFGDVTSISYITEASQISDANEYKKQSYKSFQKGAFEQAILNGMEAARLYGEQTKYEEQVEVLIHLGRAHQSLGQYKKSLRGLETALTLATKKNNRIQIACILEHLGIAYLYLGPKEKAKNYLDEGLAIAKKKNNLNLMASILNTLGNMYAYWNLYSEAIDAYKESIALAKKTKIHVLAALPLANAAAAALQNDNFKEAEVFLNSAYEEYCKMHDSHKKAYGLINLAQTCRRMSTRMTQNKPESPQKIQLLAYKALNKAAVIAGAIDDYRASSYAFGYLGQIYENEGRYQEALQLTRKALFAGQQIRAPESLYLWQWQTGRLFKEQKKIDEAISAYRNAIHTLQSFRLEAYTGCSTCNKASFQKSVKPVFFELADLLLQRAASLLKKEGGQACLLEARETIELLKAAELRDYFHDPCLDAYQSKMSCLDNLSSDTAIVYLIPLPNRLELLLSLPDGIKRFPILVGSDTLQEEVKLFRIKLEKRTTREYLLHAQRLYEWLIYPLENDLTLYKIKTLVFVPDGALRTIPMAALHDGRQFLINKFAIAVTQGLNLVDPHPMKKKDTKILLAGLTESVQGFPALINVSYELQAIQKIFKGTVLKNEDFLISHIKKELKETPYSIVHIASHGEFKGKAAQTYLLTWDGKLSMDQIEGFMKLTRFRQNPVELLTLSACQTAAGDDRAALGLAGVAMKAGARSALATLWFINDRASSELVGEFYRQLQQESISKAKALQKAQVKLLSSNRYQHPCYWSAFLMLGNWL